MLNLYHTEGVMKIFSDRINWLGYDLLNKYYT